MYDQPTSVSPHAPSLVSAAFQSVSDDAAIVAADGRRGIMLRTEWYAGDAWTAGQSFVALEIAGVDDYFSYSVAHPDLLTALFEGLAPEVRNGTVRVMATARVPGVRAKMAVATTDPDVDAVMSCVGRSANRVRRAGELAGGERIDVVAWASDPADFLRNSFAPASPTAVELDGNGKAQVTVPSHQMSAAVGRAGLNSQLAGQLVGLDVTVVSEC